MKNEIGRKITSLTLMTIMLAGGMTIAFPGFTPDVYAVNANLLVSAENTGGNVAGPQVIEILVIDDDLANTALPDVTVNGDTVIMTATNDGNWYAYIADNNAITKLGADNPGVNFDATVCAIENNDASGTHCGDNLNVVKSEKSLQTTPPTTTEGLDATTWPFVQSYQFSSTIEIQYNKAGGTQISTLKFDDNAAGLSLDRSIYPTGAQVHVTIEDHRLNIDPTSDDIWTWNMTGDVMYRGAAFGDPLSDLLALDAATVASDVCTDCMVDINVNRQVSEPDDDDAILELVTGLGDLAIRPTNLIADPLIEANNTATPVVAGQAAASQEIWFTVAEDGGPNTGIFTATNLDNNSILKIVDDAARGSTASITYDSTETGIEVKFSEATIDIQSPDDVWTSGLAIPIAIVDGDANKNSLDSNDIVLSDPNSIIPTLVTGDPFTLGEVSNNLVTWVGWSVNDDTDGSTNTEFERLLGTASSDGAVSENLNYTVGGDNPFTLKGFNSTTANGVTTHTSNSVPNAVVLEQAAKVELFSDRAILEFGVDFDAPAMTSLNLLAGIASDSEDQMNNDSFMQADFLVIDFGDNLKALQDSLINDPDKTFVGYNFLNYDVRSLNATPTNLEILLDKTLIGNITLGEPKDYINVDATTLFEDNLDAKDPLQFKLNFDNDLAVKSGEKYPIVIDFLSFGYENDGEASDERIANQIIRLELEESGDNTASLEGTLEYIMINQLNIDDQATYAGLATIDDEVSFIVIEDLTGSSAPSVTYLDVDTNGIKTQVSAQEDAPSHSGVVSLNVDSFKASDLVTVTLEDLDLNVDSGLPDVYTVVTEVDPNRDTVGKADSKIGRLLEITFNDERWTTPNVIDYPDTSKGHTDRDADPAYQCLEELKANGDKTGLGNTGFTLSESGDDTGIFVGTFSIPAKFCSNEGRTLQSVTGLDIAVNYVDFRDQSGETTEVGASAGVKANTGSISLDRTVYPVPFGTPSDFKNNDSTTPSQSNSQTRSLFPIHQSGMNGDGITGTQISGLDPGEFLPQGDLVVYVTITDPDFDVSASGKDSIAIAKAPVTVSVIRGSASIIVEEIGDTSNPIPEIAPDAGIFEVPVIIDYYEGPKSKSCPRDSIDMNVPKHPSNNDNEKGHNCILQGDILQVEYEDPTDASGQPNTVTDSATFDLRNGVLQSDKSVYIIGSDMILTLIEPDLDLDSSQNETYDLDLIKWSSSAATVTMGDADGQSSAFDPEPLSFRETGPSTGIFQIVVEIPQTLGGNSLQRGEEIDLEYTDWGPSGSDYVGDQDEDIRLTVFTSNFGATIALDQKVYSWTDKVYITVVAPDHNFDSDLIDEIGEVNEDPLRVATKGYDLDDYRLVETGFDTGIFTGEVILVGFEHASIDYELSIETGGQGPTNGYLETPSDGGISVSYEFSEDETVFTSSIIRWNIGDVQWLEASYPASATGVLRVIDPDMNLNPEAVDNFDVNIASDTDASGITLTVTETNEATGIFEGTIFFTTTSGSSGHRLRVSEGDTVTADYADATLPLPYTVNDSVSITSTTIIGTIVPPLERAPATSLRIVDTFGSSIDAVSVDQQVQITADLSNGQDRDQAFAYLIQIQNSDGVTVSLSWIAGSLSPGQSFSPSASWTPTSVGTYTVTAFVWESIDNPTALSPPLTIDVSVN